MEKEKPFTLFSVSRLNNSQVSAVKPQSIAEHCSFFQSCKSPVETGSLGSAIKNKNADLFQNLTPIFQKETAESASHLYSKLYKEAEKIKKWKVSTDLEIYFKEKQLLEYRKTTEAQRKAIQELQLENEKLSLKLEDDYNENQGLLNQSKATRHVCDLLRDTCTQAVEKANLYESERDTTMELYGDLSNIIERMITAFEELRLQAEKSRNDFYIQRNYQMELEKSNSKAQKLHELLEEAKESLKNFQDVQTTTQNELQNAQYLIICTNKEKESKLQELEAVKVQHALQFADLQCHINMLKETLQTEQTRFIERKHSLQDIMLEGQENTMVFEENVKTKSGTEREIVELNNMMEHIKRHKEEGIHVKSLTEQLTDIQKHLQTFFKSREEQIHHLLEEKTCLKNLVDKLEETEKELQNSLQMREKEVTDLKKDINTLSEDGECCSKRIIELETVIEKKELKYTDILKDYERIVSEKEKIVSDNDVIARALQNTQRDLQASKQYEDQAKKKNEDMEQINVQLRKEIQLLNEQLEQKSEELKNEINICSEKITALKKEAESRDKTFEDLVIENKSMKKKFVRESKINKALKTEVKELLKQLNETQMHHEEIISSKQNEIEDANQRQQSLSNEIANLKIAAEESMKLQKETDIRCQHKIAEIVALMEKHKIQYDKTVEEKDSELNQFRMREHELLSAKINLETVLSNAKDEVMYLKEQLKQLQDNALISQETKFSMRNEMKNKPESKDVTLRTLTRNYMQPSQQKYTGRSPSVSMKEQHENKKTLLIDSTKKKRKAALAYDFHSDSSEHIDILEICEDDEAFKKFFQKYPQSTEVCAVPPKKVTGAVFKSPGPVLKMAAIKKMREAGWSAISKVDRRKKMKASEKLFC